MEKKESSLTCQDSGWKRLKLYILSTNLNTTKLVKFLHLHSMISSNDFKDGEFLISVAFLIWVTWFVIKWGDETFLDVGKGVSGGRCKGS